MGLLKIPLHAAHCPPQYMLTVMEVSKPLFKEKELKHVIHTDHLMTETYL